MTRWISIAIAIAACSEPAASPVTVVNAEAGGSVVTAYFEQRKETPGRHRFDRWYDINPYNPSFLQALHGAACVGANAGFCEPHLASRLGGAHLQWGEFEEYTDKEFHVDLYWGECQIGVQDLRSRPWRTGCEDQSACAPTDSAQIDEILEQLHREGWFDSSRRVLIACYESCTSPANCKTANAPGELTRSRCEAVYKHLTTTGPSAEGQSDAPAGMWVDPSRVGTTAIACDRRGGSDAENAKQQRVRLVFSFAEDPIWDRMVGRSAQGSHTQ